MSTPRLDSMPAVTEVPERAVPMTITVFCLCFSLTSPPAAVNARSSIPAEIPAEKLFQPRVVRREMLDESAPRRGVHLRVGPFFIRLSILDIVIPDAEEILYLLQRAADIGEKVLAPDDQ